MTTVNLINPPSPDLYDPAMYPHLGLLYLGAKLKQDGFECKYVDLCDKEEYNIPDADFHLITILKATYQSALIVRNKIKSGFVVIGGPQVTIDPERAYTDFKPDALITGEADLIIGDILKTKKQGIITAGIVKNLDTVLYPDRSLLSITKLRNLSGNHIDRYDGDGAATTLLSSRGCPFACTYCCKIPQTEYFRMRSANNIVGEIIELQEKYNINHARFMDDCFTINPNRVFELCKLLKGRNFYWSCLTRTDTINERMLKEMHSAGCREIQFGIESGSQNILDSMNKQTTVETNLKAIEMVKRAGLIAKIFLIEAYPTEVSEDIELTKQFVIKAQPDKWTVSTFILLPGSSAYEKYKDDIRYKDRNYFNLEKDSDFKTWMKSGVWVAVK